MIHQRRIQTNKIITIAERKAARKRFRELDFSKYELTVNFRGDQILSAMTGDQLKEFQEIVKKHNDAEKSRKRR